MNCNFIKKQTIKDRLYYNNALMVNVNIDYPSLTSGYDGKAVRFNMHYRHKAQRNKHYASGKFYQMAVKQYNEAESQDFPFHNFDFVQTFETVYCKNQLISLFYDIYDYTGGAHGFTVRHGDTWDMKKGTIISLESLFDRDYDYMANILLYITEEAKHRQITETTNYFDDLDENIIKYFNQNNYYLTDEGLAVFYPLYTIAPYSEGIQVFVIPYSIFGDKLRYNL
ncbi:MAG: DUF3298 and DUF4163 domain-containing protein [Eubacteriales bacterium]